MVYLISINYKWLQSIDLAFCESYTCIEREVVLRKSSKLDANREDSDKLVHLQRLICLLHLH